MAESAALAAERTRRVQSRRTSRQAPLLGQALDVGLERGVRCRLEWRARARAMRSRRLVASEVHAATRARARLRPCRLGSFCASAWRTSGRARRCGRSRARGRPRAASSRSGETRRSEASAGARAPAQPVVVRRFFRLAFGVAAAPVSASLSAPLSFLISRCFCASKRSVLVGCDATRVARARRPASVALTKAPETSRASAPASPERSSLSWSAAGDRPVTRSLECRARRTPAQLSRSRSRMGAATCESWSLAALLHAKEPRWRKSQVPAR